MDTAVPEPVVESFKDRRGGLIAFGILLIICSLVAAAGMAVMVLPLLTLVPTQAGTPDIRSTAMMMILNGAAAVVFMWLGVGSILMKRWARALILVVAWIWLLTGAIAIAMTLGFMPAMLAGANLPDRPPMSDGIMQVVMAFTIGCLGIAFVIVPGLLVLFYRSRHVKATCEARNPQPSWTDACPAAVLTLSLALALAAVSMMPAALFNRAVMPCFGVFLTGGPAAFVTLLVAFVHGWAAWTTYKLKPIGLSVVLVVVVVWTVSSLVTFLSADPLSIYRQWGYSEDQLALLERVGIGSGSHIMLWLHLVAVPFIGYLIYMRKYFR